MASTGTRIRGLLARLEALEWKQLQDAPWSPKMLFRDWIGMVMAGFVNETFGSDNYDREIALAFLKSKPFCSWIYELLTIWPDDDRRFLAILANRQELYDVLEAYITKSETLSANRVRHYVESQWTQAAQFRELRAEMGTVSRYSLPSFPLPDPLAVLAEVEAYWRKCQKAEPAPTLEDVIAYMEGKFDRVFQAGPEHRRQSASGDRPGA